MSKIRPARFILGLAVAVAASVFFVASIAFAQEPPPSPVVPQSPVAILTALAILVAAMPETIDGWLSSKIASPAKLGFAVMLVGVLCGTFGSGLAMLGAGATLRDSSIVFAVGTIMGFAKGLTNWTKANAAAKRAAEVAGKVAAAIALCILGPALAIGALAAATEGCTTQQAQAVTPSVADLAKCVAEGALAGESLAELVAKCGGDVPAVIGALFSSKEPAVKVTKAHAEARRAVVVDAGAP